MSHGKVMSLMCLMLCTPRSVKVILSDKSRGPTLHLATTMTGDKTRAGVNTSTCFLRHKSTCHLMSCTCALVLLGGRSCNLGLALIRQVYSRCDSEVSHQHWDFPIPVSQYTGTSELRECSFIPFVPAYGSIGILVFCFFFAQCVTCCAWV